MSEYSSPKIWGPHFWYMLRCIANNYPLNPTKEDAVHVRNFFNELQYILPCEICKYTFRQHFNRHPIEKGLYNKHSLINWVETIYQETKKVIQDKRIKILDMDDDIERIEPIKPIIKSPVFTIKPLHPIENKLTELTNSVIDKYDNINNNNTPNNINNYNNENINILDNLETNIIVSNLKDNPNTENNVILDKKNKESKKNKHTNKKKKDKKYDESDTLSVYSHNKRINKTDAHNKENIKQISKQINYVNQFTSKPLHKSMNIQTSNNINKPNLSKKGLSVTKRCKCND